MADALTAVPSVGPCLPSGTLGGRLFRNLAVGRWSRPTTSQDARADAARGNPSSPPQRAVCCSGRK